VTNAQRIRVNDIPGREPTMSMSPAVPSRKRDRASARDCKRQPRSYRVQRDPTLLLSCARAWRINGFPATIHIWTDQAWRLMKETPADAQYFDGCGVWAALRMDDDPPSP
jgi:hypothetical protein